jgi:putative intracellular protease/amidase
MAGELNGRTVAILATDGFEQVELTEPVKALKEAGAKVEVVSPKSGEIQAGSIMTRATRSRSTPRSLGPIPPATTRLYCRAA